MSTLTNEKLCPCGWVDQPGCGMKLRASDPSAMKQFIVGIQSRVNELDPAAASGKSKRVRIFFIFS